MMMMTFLFLLFFNLLSRSEVEIIDYISDIGNWWNRYLRTHRSHIVALKTLLSFMLIRGIFLQRNTLSYLLLILSPRINQRLFKINWLYLMMTSRLMRCLRLNTVILSLMLIFMQDFCCYLLWSLFEILRLLCINRSLSSNLLRCHYLWYHLVG